MNSSQLAAFKAKVLEMFKPVGWNPTEAELKALANEFELKKPADLSQAGVIFQECFPDLTYLNLEGIDTSDYKTLLALALADAKAVNK